MLFRRWNNRKSRSTKDKEYRQTLLATILSFEEDVVSFINFFEYYGKFIEGTDW